MNRKILLLNIVLLALLAWLGIRVRDNWLESQAKEQATLAQAPQAAPVTNPPTINPVEPAAAIEYLNVAQQTLFATDRNNVEIFPIAPEPQAPPPPPPPPVPPFPSYHGQMAIGEPVIVLSNASQAQKSYRVGDQVGDFKLAAFDRESVTLEWNDQTLKPLLKDLRPKEVATTVASTPTTSGTPNVSPLAPVGSNTKGKIEGQPGAQHGMYRDCQVGDNSPDGTVKDGYRKTISQTLMGSSCHWEPIR